MHVRLSERARQSEAARLMDEKRYCGNCRQEIGAGEARCPHCGGDLPSATPAGGAAQTPATAVSHAPDADASRLSRSAAPPEGVLQPAADASSSRPASNAASSDAEARPSAGAVESQSAPPSRPIDGPRAWQPRVDETVGDPATVRHAVEDVPYSWTEGLLVADRFRIVRCIGQGGMGMVYHAHDETLDRAIALKRVPQEILFDGDARDDLRQEANRLLDLAHENIIRVHTYYDEPAWPFFAMEFLGGPTLKELLRSRKLEGAAFAPREVLVVARQVERGLTYAHGKGVIHRDLKPANLMFVAPPSKEVSDSDVIKITDFGISRVVADSTMRQTGKRSGTLPYMSPEQFRGEPATIQSDVYSLAASYYELLSGKPPFYTGDIGYQIVNIAPKPLHGAPKHLIDAIYKGLAKNPRHRPASVRELADAMEGKAPSAVRIALRRSRPFLKGLSLAAAALLVVALLGFWVRNFDSTAALGDGANGAASSGRNGAEASKVAGGADSEALARMAREIQSQLDDANLRNVIRLTPLRIVLKKRGELTSDILHRVQFVLAMRNDPESERRIEGREPTKDGKPVADAMEFELPELGEGDYTLRTVLFGDVVFPRNAPYVRHFRVDLTGPPLELRPVNREELLELEPGRFVTYNEETELALSTPSNPGDINNAYYQIYADSLGRYGGEEYKIADPARWRLTLAQGQNLFQVVGKDELGNPSTTTVRIDRMRLEIVKFEIDRKAGGVLGNRVWVRGEWVCGELQTERATVNQAVGDSKLPLLRFLVNEQQVEAEEFVGPARDNPVFKALLFLPRRKNTIEVRYQWGDGPPRPFALASTARLVQEVPAPRVEIAGLPAQTNRTTLTISGTIRPYFNGLDIQLLHEQMGSYRVLLKPGRDSADFSEDRPLVENRLNRFSITCIYRGDVLDPGGPPIEVYCDINLPKLLESPDFRPQGDNLQVIVVPSEPLSQLQMKLPDGEWRTVASRNDDRYVALVPLPQEKCEFLFRMVDLAGNENTIAAVCPIFDSSTLAGDREVPGAAVKPAVSREGDNRILPSSARLVKRSALLQDLGLDFKGYGGFDEEMGTTEVNEKAWNAFLRERLQITVADGDPRRPITMAEVVDPNLLGHFADWLTERSQDGYRYEIPTVEQWQLAFCGTRNPAEAKESILRWFRASGKPGFNSSPRARYGINEVLPIGERPENRTPTGLLDMESNLQEIVRDHVGFRLVIGGYNQIRADDLHKHCTTHSLYTTATEGFAVKFTGFRLLRRPRRG